MIKISLFSISLLVGTLSGFSQEGDIRLINQTGVGVRAMALANNVTASSTDLSSLYWNPGALGFIPVREVQFSFDLLQLNSDAAFFNRTVESTMQRLRMVNGGLLFSLPVSQGGFSFAFAYQNPISFDELSIYKGTYYDPSRVDVNNEYKTSGGLHFWTGGFGIQVAPNLSAGVALSLIRGKENTNLLFKKDTNSIPEEILSYDRSSTYTGFDSRAGLTYRYNWLTAGLRFCFPQIIKYSEEGTDIETYVKGYLYSSYQSAAGVSISLPFLQISAEGRVTLPFLLVFPSDNIPESSQAAHYKVGGGLGLELPIPQTSLLFRSGYSYDQLDLHVYKFNEIDFDTDWGDAGITIDNDKQTISGGIAFVQSTLSFDISYAATFYSITTKSLLKQEYLQHRFAASLSFRY